MAAPFVAGEAALVRATFPDLSNDRIVDHISDTARRIQGEVRDRIDAGAAVTTTPEPEASPSPTPSATPTPTPSATPTPTPATSSVQLGATVFPVSEGANIATVVLTRTGDTSSVASVAYLTSAGSELDDCSVVNGIASARCDYTTSVGKVIFLGGETSKTIAIPIVDDAYGEGSENFSITLNSPIGTSLGPASAATVRINDNESSTGNENPIDAADFFVRQHYLDFLGRQPDATGLAFWVDQITSCGADSQCRDIRRINSSAAFFLSIEFQETAYFVYRIHKAAYGSPQGEPVPIRLNSFIPDTREMSDGIVVLQPGWEQILDGNKVAFSAGFVTRPRFTAAYPQTISHSAFVDTLNQNAGGVLSQIERDELVNGLVQGTKSRAQVLRAVAEDPELRSAELNRAFVLMQYFGYLRRNPDDAPDTNFDGYNFWLTKLNQFNGNFVNAEMVKAFLISTEYRQRYGP